MPDWVGKTLGRVHIESLVARGGMAEVYLGTHESLGEVAVKVMRGLIERESEHFARFQREADVVTNLKHPNIVQMLDYDVLEEMPYLIMEYINGPTLAHYLKVLHDKKQRLPIGMVAKILVALASALDYAHSLGIVHRDIKPANVLLRSPSGPIDINKPLPLDVEPILTDFGLVRLMDSTMHTTTGSVSGTPAYMSPEQARGEKVDKRSDIYSLGILLYEMLAGEVPFQADTTFGMLMKHINEPPPPIKSVSFELQAVIDRTLAKDPSLRYPTAGELANEFMALFNGQTISPGTLQIADIARQVAEASKKPKEEEAPRQNRWLRIGIEVAVIAGLAGLLLFQFAGGNAIFAKTPTPTVTPTRTSIPSPTPIDPNASIGTVRFGDLNSTMDKLTITFNDALLPKNGEHYEIILLGDTPDLTLNLGKMSLDANGQGQLLFTDQQQRNLLQYYDQIKVVTKSDSDPQSPEKAVYSFIFPPQSLVHIRNLVSEYQNTPDKYPLIDGLYYYGADYIDTSIDNDQDPIGLKQAYEKGDEALVRLRIEQIINQIVGDKSDQYKDYNRDGNIDINLSDTITFDGYGSLPNGDRLGYLQETINEAKAATEASDSTVNIRTNGKIVQACVQNMTGWTNQLLADVQKLQDMPFGPDMKPVIDEMVALGNNLLTGADVNGSGQVEPIAGECGVGIAFQNAYYMADFQIYLGENRTPPTGK